MKIAWTFLFLSILVVAPLGCNPAADDESFDAPIVMDELPPMMDSHAHPDHGPHGGELVELGKEDYHMELLHGSQEVTLYVLDSAVADSVAIEAGQMTVSLKHDGEVRAFELIAEPQADDGPGLSSRFSSKDETLAQWMGSEAEGAVVVKIQGKTYTGKITHDHAGHDHDHAGH